MIIIYSRVAEIYGKELEKLEKRNAIQQGIISADGCMENCIKLRINAGNKDATPSKIKLLEMHTETNSSSLLTLKC